MRLLIVGGLQGQIGDDFFPPAMLIKKRFVVVGRGHPFPFGFEISRYHRLKDGGVILACQIAFEQPQRESQWKRVGRRRLGRFVGCRQESRTRQQETQSAEYLDTAGTRRQHKIRTRGKFVGSPDQTIVAATRAACNREAVPFSALSGSGAPNR